MAGKVYLSEIDWDPKRLEERPALVAHIGIIAGLSSCIEEQMALLLCSWTGGHARTVAEVFLSMTSYHAQRQALTRASAQVLDKAGQEEFADAIGPIQSAIDERNAVVHARWGISDQIPDALIRSRIRDRIPHAVEVRDHFAGRTPSAHQALGIVARQYEALKAYTEADFLVVEQQLENALTSLIGFSAPFIVKWREGKTLP